MTSTSRRLLIVYPYGCFDTNPTVTALTRKLIQENWTVDILTSRDPEFHDPRLSNVPAKFIFALPTFFQQHQLRPFGLSRWFAKNLLGKKEFGQSPFLTAEWWGKFHSANYNLIVGVDPQGIIAADRLNTKDRPLVYLSFEIIFKDELNPTDHPLYAAEQKAAENCALYVLQDEERLAAFQESHTATKEKVCLVPVSWLKTEINSGFSLRNELKIPQQKRIVLFAGNVTPWTACDNFEELVSYWPESFVLVIHQKSTLPPLKSEYLKKLAEHPRIFISSNIKTSDNIIELYAAADYGLAPYRPTADFWFTGKNIYHLGYASGKVSAYAQCAKPILARPLPVFEKNFSFYQCGKIYRQISESGKCLEEMEQNYVTFQNGANRFYQNCLDPAPRIESLVNRLTELAG